MATFTKEVLSASTDGRPIKVAGTAIGAATTIHTGPSDSAEIDEIWLKASNTSTSDVVLNLAWGGTTDPDDRITFKVPAQSTIVVSDGLIIKGNATPLVVGAYAATANVITIEGYINAIA